jgi:PEP-CTERM motif
MQHPRNPIARLALVALAAWSTTAGAGVVNVTVKDTSAWIGFVNRWELPTVTGTDRGAYLGGLPLGSDIAALPATVSGNIATLFPNAVPGGTPTEVSESNLYVDSGAGGPPLAGETVRFTGTTLTSTLAAPYVAYAFIREFSAGYSFLIEEELVTLVAGQAFDFSMDTDVGNNVQYGFALFGPNAVPGTVSLGSIAIGAVPEPSTLAMVLLGALGLATRSRRRA